jgi:NTE family protein
MLRFLRRGQPDRGGWTIGGVPLGDHPWVVFGGGGVRGLAHLGAWRVLTEAGLEPAGIVGTSIGALVGACIAGGRPLHELEREALALRQEDIARLQRRAVWMNGIRAASLYRADTLKRHIAKVLPRGDWESLQIRFQANAVELGSGRTEWFGVGARTDVPMVDAIYASAALPVFYPPIRLPGGVYVDGGTEDALPIRRAAELGATGIVAIDVGSGERADSEGIVSKGMLAVHERVFGIMSGNRRRQTVREWDSEIPLVYIRPELESYGTLDVDHAREFLQEGRAAAERAIASIPR